MKLIFGFFDFLILNSVWGTPLIKGSPVVERPSAIEGSPGIESSPVIEGSPVVDGNDVEDKVMPAQKSYNGNNIAYYGRWRTTKQCSMSSRRCYWEHQDVNTGNAFDEHYGTITIPKDGYYSIDASLTNWDGDEWIGCKLWIKNGGNWFRGSGS